MSDTSVKEEEPPHCNDRFLGGGGDQELQFRSFFPIYIACGNPGALCGLPHELGEAEMRHMQKGTHMDAKKVLNSQEKQTPKGDMYPNVGGSGIHWG